MRVTTEQRFSAMGTTAHVLVVGPRGRRHLSAAIERVFDLEQRWSRFVSTSDVGRMNANAGRPVAVSTDTMTLVEYAVGAQRLTGGAFDPLMEVELCALGYDRPFAEIDHPRGLTPFSKKGSGPSALAAQRRVDVVIDRQRSEVTLPERTGFDPGGIGKGLAADIVAGELVAAGAHGVMVNLGGDLAVRGAAPDGDDHWVVAVNEPTIAAQTVSMVRLRDAGLATSTTAKRRWTTASGTNHHIVDPATAASSTTDAVLATVVAGDAWWAEVTATALLSQESTQTDESALVVFANGEIERRGDFARFEA